MKNKDRVKVLEQVLVQLVDVINRQKDEITILDEMHEEVVDNGDLLWEWVLELKGQSDFTAGSDIENELMGEWRDRQRKVQAERRSRAQLASGELEETEDEKEPELFTIDEILAELGEDEE